MIHNSQQVVAIIFSTKTIFFRHKLYTKAHSEYFSAMSETEILIVFVCVYYLIHASIDINTSNM